MKLYWKRKTEEVFLFFVLMRLYLPLLPIFYNLLIYDCQTIKNIIILAVLITSVNNMRKKNKYTKEKRGA